MNFDKLGYDPFQKPTRSVKDMNFDKLGYNPFEGLAETEEAPASFSDSIGRGVDQLQGSLYGAVEAAGEATGLDSLTEFGRKGRIRNAEEAAQYGPRQEFLGIEGIGDFGQWLKQTVGEQIPVMAPSVAGGIGGAGAGFAFGGPPGAVVGGLLGAFAPNYVQSVGEVQGAIKERGEDKSAPAAAFLGGGAVAALDTVLPGKIGGQLVKQFGVEAAEQIAKKALQKPVKAGWLRRGAKGAVTGMTTEGLTEALQEAITEVTAAAATETPVSPDLPRTMIEAAAAGAVLGGGMQAGVDIVASPRLQNASGMREAAREQPLSDADRASPIADDLIVEGRQAMADAAAVETIARVLASYDLPAIDTTVSVMTPNGRSAAARIVDVVPDQPGMPESAETLYDEAGAAIGYFDRASQTRFDLDAPQEAVTGGVRLDFGNGDTVTVGFDQITRDEVRIRPIEELPAPMTEPQLALPAPAEPSGATRTAGDGFTIEGEAAPQRLLPSPQSMAPEGAIPGDGFFVNPGRPAVTVRTPETGAQFIPGGQRTDYAPATHFSATRRTRQQNDLVLARAAQELRKRFGDAIQLSASGPQTTLRLEGATPYTDQVVTDEIVRQEQLAAERSEKARQTAAARPLDVIAFVASKGGVRDDEGHALRRGRNLQRAAPGFGALIRDNGASIDDMGEMLWDAGYFGDPATVPRPDEDAVLDLLERANFGEKTYPVQVQTKIDAARQAEQDRKDAEAETRQRFEAEAALDGVIERDGYPTLPQDVRDAALSDMMRGLDPEDALVDAVERWAIRTEAEIVETPGHEGFAIPFEDRDAQTDGLQESGAGLAQGVVEEAGAAEPDAQEGPNRGEGPGRGGEDGPAETVQTVDGPRDQLIIPGAAQSAIQAQAARDQRGRGAIRARSPQKDADIGLFAARDASADLFVERSSQTSRTPDQAPVAGPARIDDIDLQAGQRAFSHAYRRPDQHAGMVARNYVNAINAAYDEAVSGVDDASRLEMINKAREDYKAGYQSAVDQYFRGYEGVVSGHIAGRSKFNAGAKSNSVADRVNNAFQKEKERLRSSFDAAVEGAKPEEVKAAEREAAQDQRDQKALGGVLADAYTIISIRKGDEPGLDAALFRSALLRKLKSMPEDRRSDALRRIQSIQDTSGVKVFSDRNKIWGSASRESAETRPTKNQVTRQRGAGGTIADTPDGNTTIERRRSEPSFRWSRRTVELENGETVEAQELLGVLVIKNRPGYSTLSKSEVDGAVWYTVDPINLPTPAGAVNAKLRGPVTGQYDSEGEFRADPIAAIKGLNEDEARAMSRRLGVGFTGRSLDQLRTAIEEKGVALNIKAEAYAFAIEGRKVLASIQKGETKRGKIDKPPDGRAALPPTDQTPASRGRSALDREALERALRERLSQYKLQGKIALALVDEITLGEDGKSLPAQGLYTRGLIQVAYDYLAHPDAFAADWVLDHETIHALRDMGVFRGPEWRALEKAALADADRLAEIRERYAGQGLTEDQLVEEAVADMFADWRAGRGEPSGALARAWKRFVNLLKAIAEALTGLGFRTADDVFAAIERGDVGGRVRTSGGGAARTTQDGAASIPPSDPTWTGVAPGLDNHGPVDVLPVPKLEVGVREARSTENLRALKRRVVGERNLNADTGWNIEINAGSVNKSMSGDGTLVRNSLTAELPQIIRRAVHVESHPDKAPPSRQSPSDLRRVHRFVAAVALDEKLRRVHLVVKERRDGRRVHYALDHAEMEGGPGNGDQALRAAAADSHFPSPLTIDIGVLLKGVKSKIDGEPVLGRSDRRNDKPRAALPGRSRKPGNPFSQPPERAGAAAEITKRAKALLGVDWREGLSAVSDNLRTAFQDQYLPLLRAQRAVEERLGRTLTPDEDAYRLEELSAGRKGAKVEDIHEQIVEPMLEEMHQRAVSIEEFETYLYARHAPSRNAYIARINSKFAEGGGSGMTDAEAQAILSDIEKSGRMEDFVALAAHIDRLNALGIKERVDAGLMTEAEAQEWRGQWDHYVPLRGEEVTDFNPDRPHTGAAGISVRGRESKMAFGRKSKAHDILAYTIMQAEEAVIRGETNRVAQAIVRLAEAAPDQAFWEVDKVDVRPVFMEATQQVVYRPVNMLSAEDRDLTVTAKFDGVEKRLTFNRKNEPAVRLAAALRNLNGEQLTLFTVFFGRINRYLSMVNTTMNPEFVVTNAFRDVQTAAINLKQFDIPGLVRQTLKGYRSALGASMRGSFGDRSETDPWRQAYQEFRKAGGRVYFNKIENIDELRSRLERDFAAAKPGPTARKAVTSLFKAIENVNLGVENAVRLSAFKAARDAGMSVSDAASLAKNLTVNFNRRGHYGPMMNSLYLFFNASVQGTAVMLTAMKSNAVRKVLAGAVATGALLEVLNGFVSEEDEDGQLHYDKISDFTKSRNIVLMIPGGDGSHLKIPLPYGYNVFFAAGRAMVEPFRGRSTGDVLSALAVTAAESFNPVGGAESVLNFLAPTLADPVVDLSRNRDFADRPIMPEQSQFGPKVPDAQRHWNSVAPHWKAVTDTLTMLSGGDDVRPGAIDVSPETLEHLFGVVTGAAGTFFERNIGFVEKVMDPTSEVTWNDIGFARKVIGGKPSWYDRGAFYERVDEIEQIAAYLKQYKQRGDSAAAAQLLEEHRDVLRLRTAARRARKRLAELRKRRAVVERRHKDGAIDRAKRNQLIDNLRDAEMRVIIPFNRRWIDAASPQETTNE